MPTGIRELGFEWSDSNSLRFSRRLRKADREQIAAESVRHLIKSFFGASNVSRVATMAIVTVGL
jgi:hypothetical protein